MLFSYSNNFILNKASLEVFSYKASELHFSNFESCKSLGKKLFSFSPLGFEIQNDYDSETSEFKLHSFRAFQRYLTNKNPTHSRRTASIFQFSARRFFNVLLKYCHSLLHSRQFTLIYEIVPLYTSSLLLCYEDLLDSSIETGNGSKLLKLLALHN